MNHYQTLGVNQNASIDEIKAAYRKLAKEHHPDRNGDPTKFKQVSDAYEELKDPQRRMIYDQGSNPIGGNWTMEDIIRHFTGENWSNTFDNTFGNSAKGQDIRMQISVNIIEQYNGTQRNISLNNESFIVQIPPGVQNGQKLKISQKGQMHPYNSLAPRGDLIITIQVLPDADLVINGPDIYIDMYLPFWDMILGTETEVKTKIHSFKIKVPSQSYDGKILRISGKGMPIWNSDQKGSLMIKLRSKPVELDEEDINLIQKIKNKYE